MISEKITVVIPTYNKAEYIEQTIESVFRQTYTDWEIVIVDDCSKDNTEKIVRKYLSEKIRYFKHSTNWGPGATFNDGIEKANTEYVTLIASDDVLLPNHLALVMNEFQNNKSVETVFTRLKVIDENGNDLNYIIEQKPGNKYELLNYLFYTGNAMPSPGIAFKKNLFSKISTFNNSLIQLHDYDLNVRALMHSKTSTILEPTVLYRRFSDASANLSGYTNWLHMCHKAERKTILDNFLKLNYDDMKKIFPQLENCTEQEIMLKFLMDTCIKDDEILSTWAFERLIKYIEKNSDIFKNDLFKFQYKDYIDLYKVHEKIHEAKAVKLTHKQKLFNTVKTIIKKIFGLR